MGKTYKRVPFTIELAKKIQSGEVEGRIVTLEYHEPVRIICFDRNCDTEIIPCITLILEDNYEYIYKCNSSGLCVQVDDEDSSRYLVIELPEETPKHEFKVGDKVSIDDYNEEDAEIYTIVKIRENLAFLNDGSTVPLDGLTLRKSKHEFKVGDIVSINEDGATYEVVNIKGEIAVIKNILSNSHCRISLDRLELIKTHKNIEYKFKPFDKVLVREDDLICWQAAFFSHIESLEDGERFAITTSGNSYNLANNEIIPYEGNEHLVGTTNNPE